MLLICFLLGTSVLYSKEPKIIDSTFCFSLELGLGYNTEAKTLLTEIQPQNFSPSVRLLWKPNHRLNIGVQTARINIMDVQKNESKSEFGSTNFRSSMKGIPVILLFNMNLYGIGLYGGLGATSITSTISVFDSQTKVSDWFYTYYFGLGYNFNLSKNFGIGIEADAYSFSLLQVYVGGFSLKLNYDFYRW